VAATQPGRQVLDRLDRSAATELGRYTATDVTPSFGQALLDSLSCPKLAFQARTKPQGREAQNTP
jgi:hypothetical protein